MTALTHSRLPQIPPIRSSPAAVAGCPRNPSALLLLGSLRQYHSFPFLLSSSRSGARFIQQLTCLPSRCVALDSVVRVLMRRSSRLVCTLDVHWHHFCGVYTIFVGSCPAVLPPYCLRTLTQPCRPTVIHKSPIFLKNVTRRN